MASVSRASQWMPEFQGDFVRYLHLVSNSNMSPKSLLEIVYAAMTRNLESKETETSGRSIDNDVPLKHA